MSHASRVPRVALRRLVERGATRGIAALTLAALVLGACAQTEVTWRDPSDHEPLSDDAPIALFVRNTAPDALRAAMLERGAERVSAFPPGERVAEFATVASLWADFDVVLDDVRTGARGMGADVAVATSSESSIMGETRFLFQLLRSDRLSQRSPQAEPDAPPEPAPAPPTE